MGYFKKVMSGKDTQFPTQDENTSLLVCQDTVYPFASSVSRSNVLILENHSCFTSVTLWSGKGNPDLT